MSTVTDCFENANMPNNSFQGQSKNDINTDNIPDLNYLSYIITPRDVNFFYNLIIKK